jgi:hypothetical protein
VLLQSDCFETGLIKNEDAVAPPKSNAFGFPTLL